MPARRIGTRRDKSTVIEGSKDALALQIAVCQTVFAPQIVICGGGKQKGTIPEKIQGIVAFMGEPESAGIENGENRVNRYHMYWKLTGAWIGNGKQSRNRSRIFGSRYEIGIENTKNKEIDNFKFGAHNALNWN